MNTKALRIMTVVVTCVAAAWACDPEVDRGCEADNDCKGDRICEFGECVSPDAAEGGEEEGEEEDGEDSGEGEEGEEEGGEEGGSSEGGEEEEPPSCAETGTYCDGNVLYDCATEEIIVSCNSCDYIGPGTGSSYDTTCKDEAADCTVCDSEGPWSGPGCYFGDGPAVCS